MRGGKKLLLTRQINKFMAVAEYFNSYGYLSLKLLKAHTSSGQIRYFQERK